MKVCFVVQRYGLEVNGGAEAYAREVAEHLALLPGYEVSCLTTCAVDYQTWENEYEPGVTVLNGVKVERIANLRERDVTMFNKLSEKVLGAAAARQPLSYEKEEEWMEKQGPYCPDLPVRLKEIRDEYDVFVFVCYLYYTTYFGLPVVADKAIFIPTAHEETPIHLGIFEKMFTLPAAFYYNTVEEKELTNTLFPVSLSKPDNGGKGGVGVELPSGIDKDAFIEKYGLSDFMLYMGRIDENKCCPEMFKYFIEYKKRHPNSDLKLVLMGKPVIEIPKRDDIVSLGFVSEEDKFSGLAACRFLVLPSKFESLSIVVLEAMKMGKPVLVSADCPVLKGHALRSNAGLYYSGFLEFEGCIDYYLSHPEVVSAMGDNGVSYVDNDYSWDKICEGYDRLIKTVLK
ncbi:MAG: glycosyltransferase family 4 protein [Clostridiales bacterium]|nr:glycosyltransferase family 4 protein [Clostridiales bacterium]